MKSDRTPDYLTAIREEWSKQEPIDLVVVVLRTSRADVYSAVKNLTLCDLGIVTQVNLFFNLFIYQFINIFFLSV